MSKIFDEYDLIGLGEFSHGVQESWVFRFTMLKLALKTSKRSVTIYNEMDSWQADNIMNNTYYDRKTDTFKPNEKDDLKIEKPYTTKEGYVGGKMWQYVHHAFESSIVYKLIKYIIRHKNRVRIVGVDNGMLDRDFDMAQKITKDLDKTHINFFWAHNSHVDSRLLPDVTYEWIKHDAPDHKFTCGYYLKKHLRDKYCIILSQAYKGENRFNSVCSGVSCEHRTFDLNYFYHKFRYDPAKIYVDFKHPYQLLTEYKPKLLEYSNSYFKENVNHDKVLGNISGFQELIDSREWTFILFWNEVRKLDQLNK